MKRIFLLLALLMGFAFSADCEGSVSMGLPTVNEGESTGGQIVDVNMRLVPGEGDAYIGVEPPTDATLQESVETAIDVAEILSGRKSNCDLLVEIAHNSEYVQGPSGGAAFALMAYSLLAEKELRDDTTMTGALHENGDVLPVGGLYEKALSARNAGLDYFLTPLQGVDEQLMLKQLDGITIYQVKDVREAADFFFNGVVPEEKPLNLTVSPLPELEGYAGEDEPEFRKITERIMELEGNAVAGLDDPALKDYFGERMLQQDELVEMGYYYTAANDAFLAMILADSLSTINEPDVAGKKRDVEECLERIEAPETTYENYEWIMGAEARLKRAENQVELYKDVVSGATREEEYFVVYELGFALAWCEAADAMYSAAGEIGGEPMGSAVLVESLDILLNISANYTEIDRSENYVNAVELKEEGKYAGAVYEMMYALAFERRDLDILEGMGMDTAEELNEGERNSLWGNIFRAHSQYLLAIDDLEGAYAVALFSKGMEGLHSDVGRARYFGGDVPEPPEAGNESLVEEEPVEEGEEGCECPECPTQEVCGIAFLLLVLPLFIKNLAQK